MWMSAVTTTAPAGEPLAAADVIAFLRGVADDEATLIATFIMVARGHVEKYTSTRLMTQTVKVRCSCFDDLAHLPVGPVQSVSQVAYQDANGQPQTLDPSLWEAFGADLECGIRPTFGNQWPAARAVDDAIGVTLVVGYGAPGLVPSAVPAPIIQAMFLLIGDYYQNREDTVAERGVVPATLPNGVDALLSNFRL